VHSTQLDKMMTLLENDIPYGIIARAGGVSQTSHCLSIESSDHDELGMMLVKM